MDGVTFNGTVSGTGYVGALAGTGNQLNINNSYWSNNIGASPVGTGLTKSGQWTGGDKALSQETFANGDVAHYVDGTIGQVLADRAAAAAAAAQAAALQASALQQATGAANVIGTTNTQTSADTPPSSISAKAGTKAVAAIAAPSIEDNLTIAQPAPPPAPTVERRKVRHAATTGQHRGHGGGVYGATIRSIDVNGQHYNLDDSGKPNAPSAPH